jgi:hypothetical protein
MCYIISWDILVSELFPLRAQRVSAKRVFYSVAQLPKNRLAPMPARSLR